MTLDEALEKAYLSGKWCMIVAFVDDVEKEIHVVRNTSNFPLADVKRAKEMIKDNLQLWPGQ